MQVNELIRRRPSSLWAVVDWRHLLSRATLVQVRFTYLYIIFIVCQCSEKFTLNDILHTEI